jgi:hypothetical protein
MLKLTDTQKKIVDLVKAQFAQTANAQIRYYWRHLRRAALPDMPARKKKQTPTQYALEQVRWQRTAALCSDSHVAAAALLKDEIALEREVALTQRVDLTPEEAHAALIEQVIQAPPSFHWEVWQRLTELHPEWTEADPGAEVVAFPGGKR